MSKKIIIGNWKMNPASLKEAGKLFSDIGKLISDVKKTAVVICLPFLYLPYFAKVTKSEGKLKKITLGAQNLFWENNGAYTGEISGEMLYDAGARYVIVGHSERRSLGENNSDINKKVKAALSSGLIPILCIGESIRDENHAYFNLVKVELEECLNGISKNSTAKIIIAYEPIWAISSTPNRKDATSDDCREMIIFIRKILSDKFGKESASIKIIYGGSVNERDAEDFLKNGGIDGLLSGRASLVPKKFSKIVKICEALNK
jgi:triosephosphate isomerase